MFSDPVTGLVRRIREVAVRQNGNFVTTEINNNISLCVYDKKFHELFLLAGRVVFLGKLNDAEQASKEEIKAVGYY